MRAAAITTLALIAKSDPKILDSVLILLKGCINDADDEVRERAFLYTKALSEESSKQIIFNPTVVESDLLSTIVSTQKDSLLKSNDIMGDLRNMINNPNILEQTKNINIEKNISEKEKTKGKNTEEPTGISSNDPLAEFKRTHFGKTLTNPKNVSSFVVKLTFLIPNQLFYRGLLINMMSIQYP